MNTRKMVATEMAYIHFVHYQTFWTVVTFSLTALEQEISDNMNSTYNSLQSTFTYIDVPLNLYTTLSVCLQGWELLCVRKHSTAQLTRYFYERRRSYVEGNVFVIAGATIIVQFLRIVRRMLDATVNPTYHSIIFTGCLGIAAFLLIITAAQARSIYMKTL